MKTRCFSCALALAAVLLSLFAFARGDAPSTLNASADDAPLLRVVPGGHTAQITSMVWTPDGKHLISAGSDKVIRIWDAASGEIVRELRGQIGSGSEGKVHAIALSPDGSTLVAGGYGTKGNRGNIRCFNLQSGQITRVLRGHERNIMDLAFSRDGMMLASSSSDATVRVWDMASGQSHVVGRHKAAVFSVAWAPDGKRIASASDDKTAVVWAVENTEKDSEQAIFTVHHEAIVDEVAWSPDGKTLATGSRYEDSRNIRLWNAATGAALPIILPHQPNDVSGLAFSPDGSTLASSLSGTHSADCALRIWSLPSGEMQREFTDSWGHLAFSPDGSRMADLSGEDDGINLRNIKTGEVQKHLVGNGSAAMAAGWSPDGSRVAWGNTRTKWNTNDRGPLQYSFDLLTGTIGKDVAAGETWKQYETERNGRSLKQILDAVLTLAVMEGEREIMRLRNGTETTERMRCMTWTPDGDIVIGSDYVLALYDSAGVRVKRFLGGGQVFWSAAVSTDGKYLAAASGDQTVCIWPMNTASTEVEPLLSLWMGRDREWVAWTPQGYYVCSPKAERVIGWQVNRGEDKSADFYPAFQFRKQFYRPDVIKLLTTAGSVEKAVEMADAKRAQKTDKQIVAGNIGSFAPPKVEIYAPVQQSVFAVPQVTVRARITDPNGRAIRSVRLLVNGRNAAEIAEGGRPITADGKPIIVDGKAITAESKAITADSRTMTEGGETSEAEVKLPPDDIWQQSTLLLPGVNTLSIVAVNDAGAESLPAQIEVTYLAAEVKPDVYVLAAGVSQYQQEKYSLNFAAKDADDFVGALQAQENRRFGTVHVRDLTNAKASKAAILDGLEWLKKNVKQNDWAILFLSGHGFERKGEYFFAPYDFDADLIELTGLPWADLQSGLHLPGRVLLVLDSCRAGGAGGAQNAGVAQSYNDTLRAARDGGIITFASCLPQETSQESKAWNNGAFTKALVEALEGKADTDGNKTVTLSEADDYVSKRVIALTENAQHTTWPRPTGVESSLALAMLP